MQKNEPRTNCGNLEGAKFYKGCGYAAKFRWNKNTKCSKLIIIFTCAEQLKIRMINIFTKFKTYS